MASTTHVKAPGVVTPQSAAQYWAEVLEEFRSLHGREPSENSADASERNLARAVWGYRLPAPVQEPGEERTDGSPGRVATQAWWERLEAYMAWKVHSSRPDDERSLNAWLFRQRRAAREGRLPESFVLALEGLEQVLRRHLEEAERAEAASALADQTAFLQRWFSNLELLARWQATHGTMPRPGGAGRERKLALWAACERTAANDGLLTKEQLQALASIPGALSRQS